MVALAIAEHDNGSLKGVTNHTVTTAAHGHDADSGEIQAAVMSFKIWSPKRAPASKRSATISVSSGSIASSIFR